MDSIFAQTYARFPELQTDRLRLRESRPEDAEAIFRALSQSEVCRFYNLSPLTSMDEAAAIVERRAEGFRQKQRLRWAIARQEDDLVIGSCGFVHWVPQAARAEIGYELGTEWQGQGLMREALAAMLDFGFEHMRLHRVEALVMPANAPSHRLLRHLGFGEEGLLREHGFWKDHFHDLVMLSLLKQDWKKTL